MSQISQSHRVVVYYQTQYDNRKFVSPAPLTSLATHLIIAAFHLSSDKTIRLNNISPEDPTYNQMWKDVEQMQGDGVKVMAMLGGADKGSYRNLSSGFNDYYNLLSSCIKK